MAACVCLSTWNTEAGRTPGVKGLHNDSHSKSFQSTEGGLKEKKGRRRRAERGGRPAGGLRGNLKVSKSLRISIIWIPPESRKATGVVGRWLSTGEVQTGDSGDQDHTPIHSKFKATLRYMRPCSKDVLKRKERRGEKTRKNFASISPQTHLILVHCSIKVQMENPRLSLFFRPHHSCHSHFFVQVRE